MDLIRDLAVQGVQMFLVLILAPLLLGFTRKVKARLLRRQGPPIIQPYEADLAAEEVAGLSRPSTRLASVIVGSAPPRP